MKTGKSMQVWLLVFVFFALVGAPVASMLDSRAVAAIAESFETDQGAPVAVHDPHEKFNRSMFSLNDKIFFYVLKPASTLYAAYFPPGVRVAVRNGFHNILFPARFVNCLLQGKGDKAASETARFLINSTMGVGGLFDWADRGFGIQRHNEDFGQTLALWGAGSGAYLVLPVLGPTNVRDFGGYLVDSAMNPIFWIPAAIWVSPTVEAGKVLNNTSLRISDYEDFKKAALDPYVSLRSAYNQNRAKEIAR